MPLHYQFFTPCAPEQALAWAGNFDFLPKWDDSVQQVTRLAGRQAEVGSHWRIDLQFAGQATQIEYRIISHHLGKSLIAVGENQRMRTRDYLWVEPKSTGCQFHYEVTLEGLGWLRLLNPLWSLVFRPAAARAAKALEDALLEVSQTTK